MNRVTGFFIGAAFAISLLISGCGRATGQKGVYIKCPDWEEDLDVCVVGYVTLDGRKYCEGADVGDSLKDLIGEFIADVDGKSVMTNSLQGTKLYSVKGYDKKDRIVCVYEDNLEDSCILDSYDDEYINTLQDVFDKFHYEPEDERLADMLLAARDSVCMEFDSGEDPCEEYDSDLYLHTVQQKGNISESIRIYPNGYLELPGIIKQGKYIYFKISDKVMKQYPEFFEEK